MEQNEKDGNVDYSHSSIHPSIHPSFYADPSSHPIVRDNPQSYPSSARVVLHIRLFKTGWVLTMLEMREGKSE
jgi:hypothetical protein